MNDVTPGLTPAANLKRTKLLSFVWLTSLPLLLWLVAIGLLGWPELALGGEVPQETASVQTLSGPVNFDECVKLALRQSPFFTKSSLEIEVRRFDEKDSKSDFFPSFNFRTRYFFRMPEHTNVQNPLDYSVAFLSDNYNPLVAHFSLKVRKIVTQIAILGHLKVISAGLHRLGQGFLELNALEHLAQLHGELAHLARENLRYARERQKLGEITPLEVEIAAQEAEVAAAEQDRLAATQEKIRESLRAFLDLKSGQPLTLDLRQARRQVLGDFDPAQAGLEEAKNRSFDLRMQKLAQELQSWNVTLAKMKFLPSVNMGAQTPDPLTLTDVKGYFFHVGLTFPLFDGFKRLRNINRQKTILKQFTSEVEVKESDVTQVWREAQEKLKGATAALRLARAQAELARLKERQGETLYRSSGEPFSVYLAARQVRVKAQLQEVKKTLDDDLAALGVRHFTGDLVYRYVHENQFQQ